MGIRFKGEEKTNVDEYCVSEGWVRLSVGKTLDRHGNPMTVKLQGTVESFDQFVVLLKNSVSQMVYKHAISTVVPSRAVRLPDQDEEEEG